MTGQNLPETDEPNDELNRVGSDEIVPGAGSEEINLKEMSLVDESNAFAKLTGSTGPQKREVDQEWLSSFLADRIYSENSALIREYLQNAETACIRAARLRLQTHPEYGPEWLDRALWVDATTGETIADASEADRQTVLAEFDIADENLTSVKLPRSLEEIVAAARSTGYDPTIEIDLYRNDREIHIEDNGIGMTADEISNAFNYTGRSGSKLESDTGGMFGAGALTFANMTGKDGGMELHTRTRRPDAPEEDYEGHRMYVYLGGVNPMPSDEMPDDFRGALFEVPILPLSEDGPPLAKFQEWTAEYADMLRVPVLYREHEHGETVTKEEYGGQSLIEKFADDDGNEPPITVHRPGEFTAVAGPEVEDQIGRISYKDHRPNTWLVSMPIERNTHANVKSFWKVAIQIHNEQGLCVAGPHRGILKENIDDTHPNDVFTPQPTGTRDSLERDDENKRFFKYVSDVIQSYELEQAADIFDRMVAADHPADVVRENPSDWQLLKRMVDYHGTRAAGSRSDFRSFIDDRDEFPDLPSRPGVRPKAAIDLAVERIYELFQSVDHAPSDVRYASKKKKRTRDPLGDILADVPNENVYMAASTGGNFEDQRVVVSKTHDKWDVIVLDAARHYDKYETKFGFKKLKHVPLVQSDDHDYDVPNNVHARNEKKSTSGTDDGKPEPVDGRTLKLRYNSNNTSIDRRLTIRDTIKQLNSSGSIKVGKPLVLFPGGKDYENISDHYDLQKFATIASCTQEEYGLIREEAPRNTVFTYDEFREWSLSTVIATEKGGRQVRDLLRDDEHIVLAYAKYNAQKLLLSDDDVQRRLRRYYAKDVLDQRFGGHREQNSDDEPPEPVFAVADKTTLHQAAFGLHEVIGEWNDGHDDSFAHRDRIQGFRFDYQNFPIETRFKTRTLADSLEKEYKRKAKTPSWHDDSDAYYLLKNAKPPLDEFLLGCHDAGFDPTLLDEGELRELVGEIEPPAVSYRGGAELEREDAPADSGAGPALFASQDDD